MTAYTSNLYNEKKYDFAWAPLDLTHFIANQKDLSTAQVQTIYKRSTGSRGT